MDGRVFDRIAKSLAGIAPRRDLFRAVSGASLGAIGSGIGGEGVGAGKNRRCRKRLQKCGGKKRCCNGSGSVACLAAVKAECKQAYPGQRCCGKEGAPCAGADDDCQCCGALFCSSNSGMDYRCREFET